MRGGTLARSRATPASAYEPHTPCVNVNPTINVTATPSHTPRAPTATTTISLSSAKRARTATAAHLLPRAIRNEPTNTRSARTSETRIVAVLALPRHNTPANAGAVRRTAYTRAPHVPVWRRHRATDSRPRISARIRVAATSFMRSPFMFEGAWGGDQPRIRQRWHRLKWTMRRDYACCNGSSPRGHGKPLFPACTHLAYSPV